MRKLHGLFAALVIAATTPSGEAAGAAPPPPPPPPLPPPPTCPAGTFCMGSTVFIPTAVTVTAGSTVTWKNDSGVDHNVFWDDATGRNAAGAGDATGDIGNSNTGSTHTRVFTTPGTYGFHCTIHAPGMKGTLTVN